jgi:hypothetical protein
MAILGAHKFTGTSGKRNSEKRFNVVAARSSETPNPPKKFLMSQAR